MFGRLLLRLLLPGILAFLLWRALRSFLSGVRQGAAPASPAQKSPKGQVMARDPVCGTFVVPNTALGVRGHSGMVYFCSEKCRQAYSTRA